MQGCGGASGQGEGCTVYEFLPLANVVCEGYVFTRVCQSFCSQGGSASVHAGIPPPGADPPGADPPHEQTTLPGTEHAGRYGQRAGGTHPTGMQSCYRISLR